MRPLLKSPLSIAFLLSLVAHAALALYWQYAEHLLPPAQLAPTQDSLASVAINAVLLPQATEVKQNTQPRAIAKSVAPAAPPQQEPPSPSAAKEPTAKPPATLPEPADSEALPHEELARKKASLPPAEPVPKDKPLQFSLPNRIKLSYEGAWGGTPIKGLLAFELIGNDYAASLQMLASVLFKTFELKQTAQGVLNAQGLETLRAEDKAINGRLVAITAEPDKQRVVISNKEGFLPYVAGGKDLISVIVQLGILVQAQSEWSSKGAAQDFTVYRPSGIKRWRYQSQGAEKTQTYAGLVDTVYIKRVPQSAEPDFEYIHHFWLDPARHGMPLRIKLEDAKSGRTIDLTLAHWEES